MASPLLEIVDLQKHYVRRSGIFGHERQTVRAVDGVSLTIGEGETLGLVGESGSGKSTLGRTILRLTEPTAGEIRIRGKDFRSLSGAELRRARRNIQVIFQDPSSSLPPDETIATILAEPFRIHGDPAAANEHGRRVDRLLELVGLGSAAKTRKARELSGGQRQRVAIARALALEPNLIIADEPVSSLDVSVQSQILNLLADLRDELGLSYLFIAHDLAVVEHISDRVAVMYLGRIVEQGDRAGVFGDPRHPYTKALMAAVPRPAPRAQRRALPVLQGEVPSPARAPSGCHFHPRCPVATDVCRTVEPKLKSEGAGNAHHSHWVACHHA